MASKNGKLIIHLNEIVKLCLTDSFFQSVYLILQKINLSNSHYTLTFRANPTLKHNVSEIQYVHINEQKNQITMYINFMGVASQYTDLPKHYLDLVIKHVEKKDNVLSEFLDIFNHIAIELYFNAWQHYHFYANICIPEHTNLTDNTTQLLLSFSGESWHTANAIDIETDIFLYYSGLFSAVRHGEGLSSLLSDYFQLPISIENYCGQWVNIDCNQLTVLQRQHHQLGIDAVIGQKVWNMASTFSVNVGPVDFKQLTRLLPNSKLIHSIKKLTKYYVGDEYSFQINITINKTTIPFCTMTKQHYYQLGWNSWLSGSLLNKKHTTIKYVC